MKHLLLAFTLILSFAACKNNNGSKNNMLEVDLKEIEFKTINNVSTAHYEGKPFNGKVVTKLKSGKPFTSYEYKDGIKHGAYATWYGNGNMQKEGFYNMGKEHGEFKEYYENGDLQRHHHWDNDKKVKTWLSYYEGGAKWTHREFENDQLNGKVYVWDEEGELGKEYDYVRGNLTNKIMHFENK